MKGQNVNGSGDGPSITRVLVLDDEQEMLKNYQRILKRAGYECLACEDPGDIERNLAEFRPEIIITDLMMPEVSGMEILQRVHAWDESIPVILVTAYGSVENAVSAMKLHAADYLSKPFSMEELLQKIQEALSNRLIERVPTSPTVPGEMGNEGSLGIIGISSAMQQLFERLRKVARLDVNVLVTGESGTGKELVARAIHSLSQRRNEVFVPIDCASLPENLLESELFGYTKGSFTGAVSDKKGLLEFAHKGTLFLDEIGEIPVSLQVKLLRVLQERAFRPIGGRNQIDVNIRVVAATNRELAEEVRTKNFRSDLYYRLNVITLRLPPLRERTEDIPLLANHFLRTFAQEQHIPAMTLDAKALDALRHHPWPGNVRELQNAIEHSATMANGTEIHLTDLPPEIQGTAGEIPEQHETSFFEKKELVLGDFEREFLINLLAENQFNISKAAEAAGCHRRTLYRMIHRQNIDLKTIQRERRAQRHGDPSDVPQSASSTET